MEVHAHTHTARKKWTHYLWEFLMLFLAVFCGFLAEYQLEHFIEKQREKKFALLLYEDFKKDTVFLNNVIHVKEWREKKFDSLFYFTKLPDLQSNATAIYYYSWFSSFLYRFEPNDATIQQLRSSGSLRYFNNLKLYNSITSYYLSCSGYKNLEEYNDRNNMQISMSKIFEAEQFFSFVSIRPNIMDAIQYPKQTLKLLTTDKLVMNEFLIQAKQARLNNDLVIMVLRNIRTQLLKLIEVIKTEYHLSEESPWKNK